MERDKNFVLAIFEDEDVLIDAVKQVRNDGVKIKEVYTPFPIHGLDTALGYKMSRLPIAAFLFGMTGTILALTMMYYMMGFDWPMNIGGKNFVALPPFIPVTFEVTVLLSALGMVATFLIVSDLKPYKIPRMFDIRSTDDKLVMAIDLNEPLKQITDKDAGNWVSSLDNGVGEYYSSNPNNPFEMNMRVPPPNTVPRNDNRFIPYKIHKDSLIKAALVKNPLDSTKAIVDKGKILFGRYCQHCHGDKGMGDGLVGQVYLGIPAYNTPAIKDKSEGHIFHVITMGKGRMNAHASQVSVTDRWKIVRYVQTLQKQ